jgi:hypothetical protein
MPAEIVWTGNRRLKRAQTARVDARRHACTRVADARCPSVPREAIDQFPVRDTHQKKNRKHIKKRVICNKFEERRNSLLFFLIELRRAHNTLHNRTAFSANFAYSIAL